MVVFGISVPTEILTAIIGFFAVIVSVLLTHFLGSRRQLKDVLKRLGHFEKSSLETMIGNAYDCGSLTAQHQGIKDEISVRQRELLDKHTGLLEKIDQRTHDEQLIRKERENILNPQQIDLYRTMEGLQTAITQLAEYSKKNEALEKRIASLEKEKTRLLETIEDLRNSQDYDL